MENLRLVMGELQIADVKKQVGLSLFTDFEDFSVFKPAPKQEKSVNAMLDQVIALGRHVENATREARLGERPLALEGTRGGPFGPPSRVTVSQRKKS